MDGNNNDNNHGFFYSLLDPQLGELQEAIGNLVRGILPQHRPHMPQTQPTNQTPQQSLDSLDFSDLPPLEPAVSTSLSGTEGVGPPSGSGASATGAIATPSSSTTSLHTLTPATNMSSPHTHDTNSADNRHDDHDIDMLSDSESRGSSPPSQSSSVPFARTTRRTRVEDDDDPRASNRQRRHSPTLHDDDHHFMPIPEDHGVLHPPPDARGTPHNPAPAQDPPQQGPVPPPQRTRMGWTLDLTAIHGRGQNENVQAPEGGQPAEAQNPQHQHEHDWQQAWNFFVNIPIPGEGFAPHPAAGGNQGSYRPFFVLSHPFNPPYTDAGNQARPGFTFPPFLFPFGMDFLEQRDDPERAQRLVNGLEDVPAGLVKRMERAGGPGTDRGQVPTCAICWESLLEPEGGGFEGNVELAKAEAAQAAHEEAASQQGRESSMNVDGGPSASPTDGSSSSSSSRPSQAEDVSLSASAHANMQHPKIVVLPCAHAFHATCLLPWFSKPGRTTCPSCRFDIDPDSLTYKPRPLRARPRPQAAPQAAAAPRPDGVPGGPVPAAPQPPVFFGLPPPPFFQFPAAPPPQPAHGPEPHNVPRPDGVPAANQDPQPEPPQNEPGQQQQPLPPFVTFDISMIIPIYPGRNPGAAPPSGGAQVPNAAAAADPQAPGPPVPPPPPPRTDNNGFRLDDTLLQETVRNTFERLFGQPLPPFVPHPPPAAGAALGDNGQPRAEWFTFSTGPLPAGFPPMAPLNMNMPMPGPAPPPSPGAPRHRSHPRRPVEKRQWAPPPAPGPTLRQVVERNEREMGLRCSDVSCGLGPSDEEPMSAVDQAALGQIVIRPLKSEEGKDEGPVCQHKFHSSCLVSAERVAGWGQANTGDDADVKDVEVSCPVCRAHGVISRAEWEEGACALA